ncbi:unnamed protein product [Caretta caretta]
MTDFRCYIHYEWKCFCREHLKGSSDTRSWMEWCPLDLSYIGWGKKGLSQAEFQVRNLTSVYKSEEA